MTKIKVCGITNIEDALCAARCGAYFLGFIFYKKSKRCVTPAKAASIINALPKKIIKVGVFVNEKPETVKRIAKECALDILQFHGDETPFYFNGFRGYKTIKAVRLKDEISLERLKKYPCGIFLFDTFKKDKFGGTGEIFDWGLLQSLKALKKTFIVSGGLSPENVAGLIKKAHPFAVDVSSGVEKAPGKKDHQLIKKFIDAVKERVN
ncbi:MAG: phosphoribosylanthranilate isomerase [Candidatus Omnitrophota bacterium]